MMDISTALKEEIRKQDQEARKEIEDDPVAFVRNEMRKVIAPDRDAFAARMLRDFIAGGHVADVAALAESGVHYHALRRIVSHMKTPPQEFLTLFAEVEIGLRPRPKMKKGKAHAFRDHQICKCIAALKRHANLTPQSSGTNKESCGCAIVAEALGLTYDAVEKVWTVRDKAIWDK
ncbi:MAG: hypothetical protein ACU0C8_03780 [Roseovarius sp.]